MRAARRLTDEEIAAERRIASSPERRWALEYEQSRRRGKAVMEKIRAQHRRNVNKEKRT